MPPLIRLRTTGLAATLLLLPAAEPVTINLLPPGPGNPRNTEGDFVRLKDGRILFIYSSDVGRTWTDTDEPVVANEGGMNVMSVSLLRMASREIALFYMRKNRSLPAR